MKASAGVEERRANRQHLDAAITDVRLRLVPFKHSFGTQCKAVEDALQHQHYDDALAELSVLCEAIDSATLRLAKCAFAKALGSNIPKDDPVPAA